MSESTVSEALHYRLAYANHTFHQLPLLLSWALEKRLKEVMEEVLLRKHGELRRWRTAVMSFPAQQRLAVLVRRQHRIHHITAHRSGFYPQQYLTDIRY
jgi:hypothetical protein